jgi:hypothetical protein
MSSHSDPTGGLFVGMILGLWTFFKGFRKFREYKVVEDTPTIAIRSVPMGLVRIRGNAQSDQLIPSPITHTPCCFYKVEVERWKVKDRSGSWEHERTDLDGTKFFLADQTGKVLVDGYSAEYDLPMSGERVVDSNHVSATNTSGISDAELLQYVSYSGMHAMTTKVEHFLEKKGPLADPKHEQMRQYFLAALENAPNIAKGGAVPASLVEKFMAAAPAMADPAKEQQRQIAMEHFRQMAQAGQLHAPNDMSAASGRYRLREYLILPGQEYNITGTCAENQKAQDMHDRNVICQGQHEKTFLISSRPLKATEKTLEKSALWMILGGAAASVICLALLLLHLKMF